VQCEEVVVTSKAKYMGRPIAKKYCEGTMKRFRLESERVKIQESKPRISDPYCNTDQGDFQHSEVNDKIGSRSRFMSCAGKTRKIVNYACFD